MYTLNESVIIPGDPRSPLPPTEAQLDELLAKLRPRLRELQCSCGSLLVGFSRRRDASTDPDDFLHMVEMEPAYRIEPYVRAKTVRGL